MVEEIPQTVEDPLKMVERSPKTEGESPHMEGETQNGEDEPQNGGKSTPNEGENPQNLAGGGQLWPHLEVEDAGVAVLEALPVRHHAVKEGLVEREGGDGRQQPAVTCRHRLPLNFGVKTAIFRSLNP